MKSMQIPCHGALANSSEESKPLRICLCTLLHWQDSQLLTKSLMYLSISGLKKLYFMISIVLS
jgi:hypothetical protein